MNTETKTRISKIKLELLRLTQENEALRNCWNKEQAENEELRGRVRCLTSENATLRHHNNSLLSQNHLLKQGFLVVGEEEIHKPVRHFEDRRIHNLEPGTIFKGSIRMGG